MRRNILCTLLIAVLAVLAVLTVSGVEAASTRKKRPAPPWRDAQGLTHTPESVGQMALQLLRWDWRPEGWFIVFHPRKPKFLALATFAEKRIDVWIRPEHSPAFVAAILTHELAHVFDYLYMNFGLRQEWLLTRGIPKETSWYNPKGRSDYLFGMGDFAESVCWTMQGNDAGFKSELGHEPNEEQQHLIRKWLDMLLPIVAGK